eukprot:4791719-Alexandrium_andersonii.AAC.1
MRAVVMVGGAHVGSGVIGGIGDTIVSVVPVVTVRGVCGVGGGCAGVGCGRVVRLLSRCR